MTIRAIILILCSVVTVSGTVSGTDSTMYLTPYTVDVSTSSAKVIWVIKPSGTDISNTPSLAVSPADSGIRISISRKAVPGRPEQIEIGLIEKLKPGTQYRYSLKKKGITYSGSFTTLPLPGRKVSFVIYGDSRSRPAVHRRLTRQIQNEKPAFVICNGDLVSSGDTWDLWKTEFFMPAYNYLKSTAFFPIRGNHEESGILYRTFFDIPKIRNVTGFDCGDAHVVIIDQYADSGRAETGKPFMTKIKTSVENDLKNTKALWKIVCIHEPVYNVAGHGSTWGQKELLPVFEQYGADLVIAGHSHLYERFIPIGAQGKKPIIHIVSGGGGVETVAPAPSPILENGTGISVPHYCKLTVDHDTLSINIISIDDIRIDNVKLVKTKGIYQKEIMDRSVTDDIAGALTFAYQKLTASINFRELTSGTDAVLDLSGFPLGKDPVPVSIAKAKGCTGWTIPEYACTLTASTKAINLPCRTAKAPVVEGLSLKPAPMVRISFTCQGRTFENDNIPLSLSAATIQSAIPVPRPYLIPHMAKTVIIDGSLEEWKTVASMPLPYMHRESSAYKFVWNEQGLFFACEISDSTKSTGTVPWAGDGLELFIDKNWSRAMGISATAAQYGFCVDTAGTGGKALTTVGWGDTAGASLVKAAWVKTTGGYCLEGFVPVKNLYPSKCLPGTTWGFNFARDDNGKAVDQFFSDKEKDLGFITPVLWGAVTLAP